MILTACITTFNRPKFFEESLKSLYSQTNKNFSILVLDNGDDIYTQEIVKKYQKKDLQLKYHKHQPLSISEQRNLALKIIDTEYYGFLDDDDIWHEQKVEEFYKFLDTVQKNISLWYSGFKFFNDYRKQRSFSRSIYDKKSDLRSLILMRGSFCGSASNPIVNLNYAKKIKGFDSKILTGEDYEFYLRLAVNYKFHFTPKPLTFIRQHSGPRLCGRLRDFIKTDINIYRKFSGLYSETDNVLLRKIATKLTRIKKPKIARKILNLKKISINREYFLNIIIYFATFLNINSYLYLHSKSLKLIKILRRS